MLRGFTEDDDFMTWVDPQEQLHQEGEDVHTSALTVHQKISNLANRWLHSRGCSLFYVGMILLNLFLIGWVIIARGYPTHWFFVTLEVFINVALVSEVVFKLVAQKQRFFASKSNWFDLVVTVLCVVSLGVYFGGPSTMEEINDAVAIFLLIFRYGMQFLRLVLFVKNNQQKLVSSANVILLDGDDDDDSARLAVDHRPSSLVTTDDAHAQSLIYNDSDDEDDGSRDINADYNMRTVKLRFDPLTKQ
ncbi:uncharacterized protein ACA1_367920 [Acanthamoeba castellanii str. Neff]|uniref:Ion transport domain-containing protein n=1 Tax=Acanthamoeba castellanii (strain ATCC 30010 / Neff) TaxID=1257118 RepID=L8GYT8_ACACF|nr:uncharacterized protein ACA1_367920 [Acanthamoeba castellanii str. Neff]ELR18092.1 hypothetical protein ACA1_367920 [Acanthamoeba castellanii str. Neff]